MKSKLVFGFVLFGLLLVTLPFVSAESNPLAHITKLYTFDEGVGSYFNDYYNDSNFTRSSMTWEEAIVGDYSAETSSDAEVAYDQDFTLTGDFSIDFWINKTTVGGYYTILAFHDGVNNDNNRFWFDSDDSTYFRVFHDSAGENDKTISTSSLSNGLHHIAVAVDQGGYMNLWVDGSHKGNTTVGTLSGITCQHLGINSQLCQTSDNKAGYGRIDQLTYYNIVLNNSHINYLYNLGTPFDYTISTANVTYAVNYTTNVNELSEQNISITFNNYNLSELSSVNLIYNGTNYSTDLNFISSDEVIFYKSLTTPMVDINSTQKEFYFEANLIKNDSSTENFTTSLNYQTVEFYIMPINLNSPNGIIGETINLSFSVDNSSGLIGTSNYKIQFNTTNYTATQLNDLYYKEITLPSLISGVFETFNIYYFVDVVYNGTTYSRTSQSTQTTSTLNLYDCSTSQAITNTTILNISLFDETTGNPLTSSVDASFEFVLNGTTITYNASVSYSGSNNYGVCVYPTDTVLDVSQAYFSYSATGYDSRIYYLLDTTLSNQTTNLYLYLLNSSLPTDVSLYVFDTSGVAVSGAYINVQRYYPSNNSYSLVEKIKTDPNGLGVVSLILNDITYKFSIDYAGNTVYTSTPSPMYTNTLYFYVSLLDQTPYYEFNSNSINYNLAYNNNTDLFTFYFSDSSGAVTKGCLSVYKNSQNGGVLLDESCLETATGTLQYQLNQTSGSYYAEGSVYYGTLNQLLDTVEVFLGGLYKETGEYGTLLSVILTGTIAFAGLFMAEAVLVLTIIGLIASWLFGLVFLTKSMVIGLLIVAGIILFKGRK